MRSTFFDRPLEYQLLTAKEEWLQGEPIEGKLSIRNMNPEDDSQYGRCAFGLRKFSKD